VHVVMCRLDPIVADTLTLVTIATIAMDMVAALMDASLDILTTT